MRLRTMAPTGTFHATTRDCVYRGFRIPGGSLVLQNLWSVHRERAYWGDDVDQFWPERHMVATGDGGERFRASGHVVAFGMGPRNCAGWRLAMREVRTFVTAVFGRFHVSLHGEVAEDGVSETVYEPLPFKVALTARKQ